MTDELERLREFAYWVISGGDLGFNYFEDIDGGDIQRKALELGLIVPTEVTEPCSQICVCAEVGFPAECFKLVPSMQELHDDE